MAATRRSRSTPPSAAGGAVALAVLTGLTGVLAWRLPGPSWPSSAAMMCSANVVLAAMRIGLRPADPGRRLAGRDAARALLVGGLGGVPALPALVAPTPAPPR